MTNNNGVDRSTQRKHRSKTSRTKSWGWDKTQQQHQNNIKPRVPTRRSIDLKLVEVEQNCEVETKNNNNSIKTPRNPTRRDTQRKHRSNTSRTKLWGWDQKTTTCKHQEFPQEEIGLREVNEMAYFSSTSSNPS